MAENPLHKLMSPRSIAVMGASNNITRMGSVILAAIISGKFKGPIYPLHPKEEIIFGLRAYRRIKDLPETPGLLILVIPTTLVPDVLEEAGAMGVDRAIIITAGYDEVKSDEGSILQNRINETVAKYGIRYVGPNCIGIYNAFADLNTTVFPNRLPAGKIGMISHSGTYLSHMFPYLESLKFNYGEGISLGNAASIDTIDAMEYFEERDDIKVIAMYLEGMHRAELFIETARRISVKKPVVAIYVGGTEGGARSSVSHTAAITVEDKVVDAAFRQSGVIRAEGIEELLDLAWAFAEQPLPAGDRMAIVSVSGGPASSMADYISRCGLRLPKFSAGIQQEIRKHLPHTGACVNPVDITYSMNEYAFAKHIPEIVLRSDEIDGLFIYGMMSFNWLFEYKDILHNELLNTVDPAVIERDLEKKGGDIIKHLKSFNKPVLGSTFQDLTDPVIKAYRQNGLPVFSGPEKAVKIMSAMNRYRQYLEKRGRI
ncbi:MAG: CoA-binding protein [Spirochaetes bacterium]|nr:CoA-binding protein [Spirochaetota bacterium]